MTPFVFVVRMSQPPCTLLLFKPERLSHYLCFLPLLPSWTDLKSNIVHSQVVWHVFTGLLQAFNRHSYFSRFWVSLWILPRHMRGLGRWGYTDWGAQFLSFQSTDITGAGTSRKIQLHRVSICCCCCFSVIYCTVCRVIYACGVLPCSLEDFECWFSSI